MNLELSTAPVTAMSPQRRLARLGGHVLLPSHAGEYAPDAERSSYRVIVCGMTQEVYMYPLYPSGALVSYSCTSSPPTI